MNRALFRHKRIWTGSPEQPWVEALLVEDGRVVEVGAGALTAGAARVVDLPGAVVVPGLHDAHLHTGWLAEESVAVDLRETRSLAEALTLIEGYAAHLAPGADVRGGRWNRNRWAGPGPDRRSLDSVTGGRVAVLPSVDGHSVWANSAALAAAGVTRDTPDPVGGEIERGADGEPSGLLFDDAIDLLPKPEVDAAALRRALETVQRDLLAVGLTAITDIDGEDVLAAYIAMHQSGALRLRVAKCIRDGDLEAAVGEGRRAGAGDDRLRVGPVKFFADGALGSRTAHLTQPYLGQDSCGLAVTPYPLLLQRIRMALEAGLDVCTHAIGDAANRAVLDAYAQLRPVFPDAILRVEHAQHVLPDEVARFARLRVVASMQPTHCTTDHDVVDSVIGPRPLKSYAWRSMLDAGVDLAFGSDAPVEEPNPFHALHAAVTRQRADSSPLGGWQPAERIRLAEALHAHTVGSWQAVRRRDVGRLVPGQLADLVCLDRDLWQLEHADPAAIRDTVVEQTWVGGKLEHERD
ncbi:MAG: amidohydrolase [Intrasporangium sp.]|uniref:amidohydrolase n=1 Tax=Intrasporangium sp. TaxID=1925024 RepID=UPI0026484C0C|nr:amidohydrolase [Intrasporangium sp.]MDN5795537.1 amidohydrolase [Intrasporangium sp.]